MKPFELGKFIKEKRKQKKITQKELAGYAGITRQTLSKIEQGKLGTVSVRALILILEVLGYELDIITKTRKLPPLGEELKL